MLALYDDVQVEDRIEDFGNTILRKKRRSNPFCNKLCLVDFENFMNAIRGTGEDECAGLRIRTVLKETAEGKEV